MTTEPEPRAFDNGWGCTFHRHFGSAEIHRDGIDCADKAPHARPVYVFDPDFLREHDAEVIEKAGREILDVMTNPERRRPKKRDAEFATDLMNDTEWAAQIMFDRASRLRRGGEE